MDMMILSVFILGYIFIALEHPLHIDKGASALILGMVTWAIYVMNIPGDADQVHHIIEHGIDGNRIKGKGYGGTKPISSNASEETRKLNRRVEITILKN